MACFVLYNGEDVLKLSNLTTASFYEKLMDKIVQDGLGSNSSIVTFITQWDQDLFGLGCSSPDVYEAFKDKPNDLLQFITMFNKVLQDFSTEKEYDSTFWESLYNFREMLIDYYKIMMKNDKL